MNMKNLMVFATLLALFAFSCKSGKYADLGDGLFADIQTNKGDIVVKLEHDKTPVTVANFVSLAEGKSPFVSEEYKDKPYYDGIIFHRVIKDFMIQCGDPTGTGQGNPGYKFKDEIVDSLSHSKKGILSMANSGPKTNGSQFFITHKETPWLDGRHTVFGEVIEGMDVVDSIAVVQTADRDRPVEEVRMDKVIIVRNGKDARKFDAIEIMNQYFEEEKAAEEAFKQMKLDLQSEFLSQKEEASETDSGLRILKLKEGSGEQPTIGKNVLVNYAGWFMDGELFDSNDENIANDFQKFDKRRKEMRGYEAVPMQYGPEARLIPGFREGLQSMNVGDKVRLFIPSHLAYGPQGSGPIPPNTDLVFDLEILGEQE